ncbi:MAG: GspH/FimT family pseudopilin [Burkholderiaceae bacterium]
MQRGFTLIEMIIGVAIVGVLLALGVPSFSTFIQNSKIRNGAEAIQNGLSVARSEAVKQNTLITFNLRTNSSWEVCKATDTTNPCTNPIQSRSEADGSINATVAPTPSSITSVTFNSLGQASSLIASGNSSVQFDVQNPTAGLCFSGGGPMRCLRVVVSSGGQVRMCDPARISPSLPAPPDPLAC